MPHPVRTCLGCREKTDKAELLRIVWHDGGPVADPRQIAPGRGAYLHRTSACLELAVKRKALTRALRVRDQGADPDAVRAALGPHLAAARY